uniref:hypothetical protein n=1 Tax=Stenotrophomonas maltophilia TaxID=40324 RepID=UPI000A49A65B
PTLDDGGQIMQGLRACDGTHGSGIIAICEGGRRNNHPKREESWKHTVPERLRHDDHRSGKPSTVHSRHEGGYEESFNFSEVVATRAIHNFQTSCMDQCMERP